MSNALLEGLAWGLPAVVSDIPGNRELVVDGVNGRVVRVGDAETLSQAILELLVAPDLRRLMGARAREGVRHSYSAEAVVDRLFAVYAEIMADPTSDPSASRNRESA
jgi:glycosyltransferase involved in cell wall biosynthesis